MFEIWKMLENPALVLPVVRQKAILLAMPFAKVQADQLSHICKQVTGAGHHLPMQIVVFAEALKGQIILCYFTTWKTLLSA